jgi:hypothetical protein
MLRWPRREVWPISKLCDYKTGSLAHAAAHSFARKTWLFHWAMPNETKFSLHRRWASLAAIAAGLLVGAAAPPPSGETAVICSNESSGVTWQIRIDYDRSTVDANPARISDTEISWRDRTDGVNYTLDRKTGKLTMVFASATGGNFLFHHCRLGN